MPLLFIFFIKLVIQRPLLLNTLLNSKVCRFIYIIFCRVYLEKQFTLINTNANINIVKLSEINILSSEVKVSDPPIQGV